MLPPGVGPLAGGLNEDSKFCAELFLRTVGRGMSDIGGLEREIAAGKAAIWGQVSVVSGKEQAQACRRTRRRQS